MAITNTQEGVITEAEFAKIVILTTDGLAVPARRVADDDRRDFEIHVRRQFRESIAFFAHFDVKAMRFTDPVFLVPSGFVHKHARNGTIYGEARFAESASLEPKSRDKWAPFRLSQVEVGPRLLEILGTLGSSKRPTARLAELTKPDIFWVAPRVRALPRLKVKRAA